MKEYVNARDVLPEELFQEVKKHYTGMMYVPQKNRHQDRRKLVLVLHKQNTETGQIARIVGLGERRIRQIIAEERDKT